MNNVLMWFLNLLPYAVFAAVISLLVWGIMLIEAGCRRRSPLRIIAGFLCTTPTLFIAGMIILVMMAFSWATSDHTNPADYHRTLHELHGIQSVIAHFPPSIPAEARHVRFFLSTTLFTRRYESAASLSNHSPTARAALYALYQPAA